MIKLSAVYIVAGLLFAAYAVLSAADRTNPKRWRNALFWGLFAASFLAGDRFGDLGNGVLVLVLALTAGLGSLGRGAAPGPSLAERAASAVRFGNRLFVPALVIPVVVLVGTLALKGVKYRPIGASRLLQRNLLIYGLGGVVAPFVGIKLVDLLITTVGLA